MRRKKYVIQVFDSHHNRLFLKSIELKPGTIFVTSISFTADREEAATFEKTNPFNDACDAVDHFMDRTACGAVAAPRNSRGIFYAEDFK